MLQAENRIAVIDARVVEIDIRRMVGARAAGDNEFLRGHRLNRAVMTLQRQSMLINEVGIALQNFTVVALIESLAHMSLLVDDAVGMVKDVGERRAKKAGVVAVEGVLVKLDNTADGMAEGFRRDGAPVGATAADIMVALDDGNACSLFHQSHGGAFAARTGTNHYCIIIPRV